jgi:hypothetical protein
MHPSIRSALVWSLVSAAGCGSGPAMVQAVYEACASDENWRTFDDYETTGRIQSDPSVTPLWIMPANNATIPAAMPPILQWQPNATLAGMLDGDATCPQFQPTSLSIGRLRPLHLPPVSGTVYDLHFAVGGQDSYRVITTRQRVGVPANVFASWAGQTVTVTMFEAKMLMNQITSGPAQAPLLTLQVTP